MVHVFRACHCFIEEVFRLHDTDAGNFGSLADLLPLNQERAAPRHTMENFILPISRAKRSPPHR